MSRLNAKSDSGSGITAAAKLLISRFSRVRLCATPETAAHRLPHPWGSPGKNTGTGLGSKGTNWLMLQRKLMARGMSGGRRVHRVLGTEAKMISPGISLSGQLTLLLSGWLYSQIPCTSRIAGHFEPKPSHVQSRRK